MNIFKLIKNIFICPHTEFEPSEYHQNGKPDRYRCKRCGKDESKCK